MLFFLIKQLFIQPVLLGHVYFFVHCYNFIDLKAVKPTIMCMKVYDATIC